MGPTGYTTVKGAFDAINAGTHQGAINIEVCLSTTEGTTPATLNSSGAGAAVYTSVNLRPLADGLTVTGNPATGLGVIQLKGADNVTIDGDNPNSAGTNRNLTIANTNTTTAIAGSVIRIATAATVVTSADNNTIRNLVLNGNVTAGNAAAITSATGSSNSSFVIYAGGNGGASATDAPTAITSVTTNTAPSGTTINNLVISNNSLNQAARALVFNGAAATVASSLTISNNLIGADAVIGTVPPINAPNTTIYTKGIWVNGANGIIIQGNTVRNILSYVGTTMTAVELVGAIGASLTIADNTITGVVNNGTANIVKGILINSATGSYLVAGNSVSNVQSSAGASGTAGIDVGGSVSSAVVERNQIASVYNRSPSSFGAWGLSVSAGTAVTVRNNFISDINGAMAGGSTFSTTFGLIGLRVNAGTGHRIHNNTVNMSGALFSNGTTVLTAACAIGATGLTGIDMRNNICANTMTGSVASTSHVSLFLPSGGTTAMNLTLNNNTYFAGPDPVTQGIGQVGTTFGTGFYLASDFNAAATTPASNLRNYTSTLLTANTNNDNATIVVNPGLVSATNLHINVGSPAQNAGATISTVTNDIDQQLRPGGGLYDIGADEVDGITPPANDVAATAFIDPTSGGYKLINSPFSPQASFTNMGTTTQTNVQVRYRILNAMAVEVYNQTALIPSIAFNGVVTVTFPALAISEVGSYTIFATAELPGDTVPANDQISGTLLMSGPLAGAYTVGTGGTFTSLTNSGGLFQTINGLGASANLSVTITSDLTGETGTNALNQIAGGFALSIQPTGARVVTGASPAAALIDLNGADGVTIDGLNLGGNSLLIRNTANGTVRLINDASNNIVRNLTLETATGFTSVNVSTGTTTGNDDNLITRNVIRSRTDVISLPFNGVGSFATLPGAVNSNLVISDNLIQEFSGSGIVVNPGTENVTITGNTITQLTVRGSAVVGINHFGSTGTNLVSRNTIRDFSNSGSFATDGMIFRDARATTVSRNRIFNFSNAPGATGTIGGIGSLGSSAGAALTALTIINNMVTIAPANASNQVIWGIYDFGFASNIFTADHNSVFVGGTSSGTSASWAIVRRNSAPTTYTTRNNLAFNARSGTGNHFAAGDQSANTGTFVSNFNSYAGTGTTAASFMDLGTAAAGTAVSFATWQAGPPARDANSIAGTTASFVSSDIFVDTVTGDLHLKPTAGTVLDGGTPLAGVTTDFDNDARSATTPDIGADELVVNYTVGGNVTGLLGSGLVLQNTGGDNLPISANGAFTFTTPVASGALYAVTVSTQPGAPAQTCLVTNGSGTIASANVTNVAVNCTTNTYTIGGTVTGLAGTGLVLQNNLGNDLPVGANGAFVFTTPVASGAAYSVTVLTQPGTPTQTCLVTNGSGTVTNANVTDVSVNCMTNTFTVGGTLSGLAASSSLILQNNGGDNLPLGSNGNFTFATPVASGSNYAVTVSSQPGAPAQTCLVSNGTGTVTNANVTNVVVNCTTNTYTVGGTVTGLSGTGLTLQNNGGNTLAVASNGAFTFTAPVASGANYVVTVLAQPGTPTQTCVVTNGSGTITNANVTNIAVNCTTNTYTIGGTVSGLSGTGLVLRNNGGDNLPISANGTFTFTTPVASGTTYLVTAFTQPSSPTQTCTVTNETGTVTNANVTNVAVTCTTNTFTVGGTVSGLTGTGLVLQNNGGNNLSISGNGAFTFTTPVASGAAYSVTVSTQPGTPTQTCSVTNGTGTIAAANVTNVTVACTNDNTAPTVTPVAVTRRAGDLVSNSTIANVNDAEDAENTLAVTIVGSTTVNGVTVSGIAVSAAGVVTANVVAACGATSPANFTLRVTDSGSLFAEATLSVTVNPNLAPVLTYTSPQSVVLAQGLTINPATGPTDTGPISGITLLSQGTYTGGISVNNTTGVVTLTSAAPAGTHTLTIRAADSCSLNTDAPITLTVTPSADLSIVKQSSLALLSGGMIQYTITASNPGPSAVTGARVEDVFAGSLTGVSWTCAGTNTATCTASGTGNINQLVNLPVNSTVVFSITANVVQPLPQNISNTATITPPVAVPDPVPGNNTSTVNDQLFIFRNGFEDTGTLLASTKRLPLARAGITESLLLPRDSAAMAAIDAQPVEFASFDVDGVVAVMQARRLGGEVEVRLLKLHRNGTWTVGSWNALGTAAINFEWSNVGAAGTSEVTAGLRIGF